MWVGLTALFESGERPRVSTSKPGESLCGSNEHTTLLLLETSGLNLQAWRIPLWVFNRRGLIRFLSRSQPPSLENPFVGRNHHQCNHHYQRSQPPSLENPFVGRAEAEPLGEGRGLNLQAWRIPLWVTSPLTLPRFMTTSLNLQAWRIPLWESDISSLFKQITLLSQPPSLENPFVGRTACIKIPDFSASQPPSLENPFVGSAGVPYCLIIFIMSQPPSLENPFVGDRISFTLKYT